MVRSSATPGRWKPTPKGVALYGTFLCTNDSAIRKLRVVDEARNSALAAIEALGPLSLDQAMLEETVLMAWAVWFEGFNQTLCSAVDIVRLSGRRKKVPEKETIGGDEGGQKRVVELSRRASSLLLEKEKLDEETANRTIVA